MRSAYIGFAACLLILGAAVVWAVKSKSGRGITGMVRRFSAGVVPANMALLLPLLAGGDRVALGILDALQTGSLDADYRAMLGMAGALTAEEGSALFYFYAVYKALLTVLLVLAPLLLGSSLLTLFEGVGWRCEYLLGLLRKEIYYFSELNERSLALAKDVRENGRALIVFCNVGADNPLRGEADRHGFLPFKTSESDMKFYGFRQILFFEIAEEKPANLSGTLYLIKHFSKKKKNERVRIFLFTDQAEAEIMMDATDKNGLSVTVVNEPVMLAHNLLFDQPLYRALDATGDSRLSVLAVGTGWVGREVVKAAAWCGQMADVPCEIIAVDQRARWLESVLRRDCPELMDGSYDIRFVEADIETDQFERALDIYGKDVNYIVVSLGSDDLNVRTALYLRGYYMRGSADFRRQPVICVQASSRAAHACLTELTAVSRDRLKARGWLYTDKAQGYDLRPFGFYESIYSHQAVAGSAVEKLALNVHAVYERTMNSKIGDSTILRSYQASEVGKRSSRANAIHVKYKLYTLGFEMRPLKDGETATAEERAALVKLRQRLGDSALLNRMAELEHGRWSAFQRSEGYRGASAEQAKIYRKHTNESHIHRRAKLHACICPWEDLPDIAAQYDPNMINYDVEMIRRIPEIIGAQEGAFNLGGAAYAVRERCGN